MSKDPHIANIFSAEEEDCLSLEQMSAYQEGRLQGQAKHLVERHLLNCELCAMTIESLAENDAASIAAGAEEVSDLAWERLQHRESRKRRGAIFWLVSAASIALLITVGYFSFKGPSDEKIGEIVTHAMTETPLLQPDSETKSTIAMADEPQMQPDDRKLAESEDLAMPTKPAPTTSPTVNAVGTDSRLESTKADPRMAEKESLKGSTGTAEMRNMQSQPLPTANTGGMPVPREAAPKVAAKPTLDAKEAVAEPVGASKSVAAKKESAKDEAKRIALAEESKSYDDLSDGDYAGAEDIRTTNDDGAGVQLDQVVVASERSRDKQGKASKVKTDANQGRTIDNVAPSAPSTNYYADGIIEYEQGNYREAAANLRKATEATPGNLQAHLYAADAYLRIAQPQAALYHVERILATPGNSSYETAEWYKALAYLQLKESRKAEKQLEQVIARNGKFKALAEEALKELK